MTIDNIFLYIGIASGLGILGMVLPAFVRKLLNGNVSARSKSLIQS